MGWGAFWLMTSLGARKDERTESPVTRALHLGVLAAAFAVVFRIAPLPFNIPVMWDPLKWIGVAVCAAGLGFAIWARVHLGAYWSGRVALKEAHQVIRSGPYAWVRHPIYSGFIVGFLGAAIASGTVGALASTLAVAIAYLVKIRREEQMLAALEGYGEYRKSVRAVIPFVF